VRKAAASDDRGRSPILARLVPGERLLIGWGSVAVFLLVWEATAAFRLVDPMFISSPLRVLAAGREAFASGEIWKDIEASGNAFLWGYLLSIAVGVPIGLAMGLSRRASLVLSPIVDALNAVPRITLLPLIVIWAGIGIWSKIAVVFLGAVIPIAIYTVAGARQSEARFLRVARSFGASRWKIFTSLVLPGVVPFVFTGLKYGAGRALLGVVVGELYASTAGLGHMIANAGNAMETDVVFLGVLLFTLAGLVIVGVLEAIERRLERWRPEVSAGGSP
jgi:ABC-type nitrate/sulfonate/bicarbonate transport system permease component